LPHRRLSNNSARFLAFFFLALLVDAGVAVFFAVACVCASLSFECSAIGGWKILLDMVTFSKCYYNTLDTSGYAHLRQRRAEGLVASTPRCRPLCLVLCFFFLNFVLASFLAKVWGCSFSGPVLILARTNFNRKNI
jgi:hypothetical protein